MTAEQKSTDLIGRLAILFALLSLAGCGWVDRGAAYATGYSRSCIDGVEYLQFASGATVAYTPDGKVKTCSKT